MEIPENCNGCIASCVCETMNVPGCSECVEFHKLVEEKFNNNQQTKVQICPHYKKTLATHKNSGDSVSLDVCKCRGKL